MCETDISALALWFTNQNDEDFRLQKMAAVIKKTRYDIIIFYLFILCDKNTKHFLLKRSKMCCILN